MYYTLLQKTVKLYVPEHFNPLDYEYGYELCYFGHILYLHNVTKKIPRDEWDYEPLNAEMLHNVLGNNYAKYLRQALALGLIEKDKNRNYCQGRYSTHYRIGDKYRMSTFRKWSPNRTLRAKLIKHQEEHIKSHPTCYQHALKWFDGLTIEDVSLDYLTGLANMPEHNNSKSTPDERIHLYQLQIENIKDKCINDIRDSSGRLYTSVTNLKSELRQYLRYDGKRLYEIDIKTSQPLFLGLSVLKDLIAENSSILPDIEKNPLPYVYQNMCKLSNTFPDLKEYFDLIQYGDLYAYMKEQCGKTDVTRDDFKIDFFGYLFGPNLTDASIVLQVMRDKFPTIHAYVKKIKQVDLLRAEFVFTNYHDFVERYKEYYAELSRQMRIVEADCMYNTIVNRLMNEFPQIPIFTIHDSILTTHPDIVRRVMSEEFQSKHGVSVQLKTK